MKRLILMFLVFGVAIMFSGCSKDNSSLSSDLSQSDQETTSLKAAKVHTHFTGTSTPIDPPIPDVNAWYDEADDPRVTGVSIWVSEPMVPIDEITFRLLGTADLFMGAEEYGGEDDGKWEMTWKGTMTLTSPDGSTFRIVVHAVGEGTEGDVEGLTAKWKYTMDFDGTPETFKYVSKGKITGDR